MRAAQFFGRACFRQRSFFPSASRQSFLRRQFSFSHGSRNSRPSRPFRGPTLLAGLSPAAFVTLNEQEYDDGKTGEEHMLEASREELNKSVPEGTRGLKKAWASTLIFLDLWIVEPIFTGLRFVHLLIIFVPVIVTIPVIWIGPRQNDRDGERSGTLWWYSFLVHSMERAGPAFIKVHLSVFILP